jgi:ubiquinone/menaquinone biosynthesis C-methylase UbiE
VANNAVRGRFNAWLLTALDGYMHRKYADIKSRLLAGAPPVVVELGPGSGANLRYLRAGTQLIAIEPNRQMHDVLRRRADQCGIDLHIRELAGEHLDLSSASVDFVFCSLVLCSVDRPEQVLAEVRRVLKPGGRFACVEHVAAPVGSRIEGLQRVMRGPWKWLFEGCDLCRATASTLRSAGFAKVNVQPFVLRTFLVPARYQIAAMCVN